MPELERLLVDLFTTSPKQCIVIDALDECEKEEQQILLTTLRKIMNSPRAKPKLFLTSGPHIGVELNRFLEIHHRLSMTSSDVDNDITAYIESSLAEKKASGELIVGVPHLIDDIQDALVKGAKGM